MFVSEVVLEEQGEGDRGRGQIQNEPLFCVPLYVFGGKGGKRVAGNK